MQKKKRDLRAKCYEIRNIEGTSEYESKIFLGFG